MSRIKKDRRKCYEKNLFCSSPAASDVLLFGFFRQVQKSIRKMGMSTVYMERKP